jgi:hypothetical protein
LVVVFPIVSRGVASSALAPGVVDWLVVVEVDDGMHPIASEQTIKSID